MSRKTTMDQLCVCLAAWMLLLCGQAHAAEVKLAPSEWGIEEGKECVKCHTKTSAGLAEQWRESRHARVGMNCLDCHQADASDVDAIEHEGFTIATIVSPKDCGRCHVVETEQNSSSVHANAVGIIANRMPVMAGNLAGDAIVATGCAQCHGSVVKVNGDGTLDKNTWPNSGIGRFNPDGSKGSCHAFHSRHAFEAKLARNPENCCKCHMRPHHPQIELYEESKHGIAFHASKDHMALDGESWILGKVYYAAPSCSTCHISGYMTPKGEVTGNTHDVGDRISRTLRPVISSKLNRDTYGDGFREDFPQTRELPAIGDTLPTREKFVDDGQLVTGAVARTVKQIATLEERREALQAVF